jgi:hypothetical protein
MAYRSTSLSLVVLVALGSVGCESMRSSSAPATTAQQVVDDVARQYPNVVRLTLHAKPAGSDRLQAVGSTSAEKRGKPSDPEDVRALQSGQEVVLQEGQNLDVTLPMTDGSGKPAWVAGVTLRGDGRGRDELVADARTIARALDSAIRTAKQPLW